MACETSDFQNVLGDLTKGLEKCEHPMDDCFVERIFQMILSITALNVGLGCLNDFAISFALIV